MGLKRVSSKLVIVILFSCSIPAMAKKAPFSITSDPPGAVVEMNGKRVGETPYSVELEEYVFKGAGKTIWSKYLNEAITVTVSKDGCVPKSLVITKGPLGWYDLNGALRKTYYVIIDKSFHFKLEKIGDFLGANPLANHSGAKTQTGSLEDIVSKALPAVVTVKSEVGTGSGFFILDSGVLVTNKHVVSGSSSISVVTGKGNSYESDSIFVHPSRDLALVKIHGNSPFPTIPIADPSKTNIGAEVIAIGSPGVGSEILQNTVTKGIVSAFRETENQGLLLQTDVAINPGNSGGPLINASGEAVGVNTLKVVGQDKSGLNFAIFVSEIIQMLKEHFDYTPNYSSVSTPVEPTTKIMAEVKSEPDGAEIYIDGKYFGSTPSRLSLSQGEHTIRISRPGFDTWERRVQIESNSSPTVNAILIKTP
jgi:serine protease Do